MLFGEPGAKAVHGHVWSGGVIGATNLAEVLAKLSDIGVPVVEAALSVAILGVEVAPFTEAQAQHSAALRAPTLSARLSLGDRACLALAAELGIPVVTADRTWATMAGAAGVDIQVIR